MAEWTKNQPSGSSTRRKWNLDDRASLNNLKVHIASEGCSDVQFDLAKELLDTEIQPNNATPNQQQAVHWLVSAAQQGHEEATLLLRELFEKNCGITPENESEVRCCLSMTPGERAARKAARELFSCLSNGGESITPKQLERKMRKIYNLQKRRRRRHDQSSSTSESDSENENAIRNGDSNSEQDKQSLNLNNQQAARPNQLITEENLVSAAVNYAAGRLPSVNDALIYSVPSPDSLDHVPCFYRLLLHPAVFCTILYHRLINYISAIPIEIPPSVRFALVFLVFWLTSSENLTKVVPIGFYYFCLAIMIWSTCKMLKTKQDFIDFRIWSGLFLRYGDHNIEAGTSENRFLKNNMKPYLYFFCGFVGNLIVYPLISNQNEWLIHSELTIISCMFAFISMIVFMYSSPYQFPDWVMLISFGVNVLAKYPYEMDEVVTTGWRFLDLKFPTFCTFVIGNGIEFCLNCRTALYLLIPGLLVHLAKRSNWHGTYTYLIPHCVTLSWLQLCIISAQSGATMLGVIRATFGLAGILLFLPLFGIVSLLIPVFVAIDWMGFTQPSIRWFSTVFLGIMTILGSCFLALSRSTKKYATVLQILLCIMAACVLTFPYMISKGSFKDNAASLYKDLTTDDRLFRDETFLTWQRFYEICDGTNWETHTNRINVQLRCSHLEGMKVKWEGIVYRVQIRSVSNMRVEFINKYFPHWLAQLITCICGDNVVDIAGCNDPNLDEPCYQELEYFAKKNHLKRKCHLNKWNTYDYEIHLKMYSSMLSKNANVILQAGHKFGNFTRRLAPGDRIFFRGALLNSVTDANGHRKDYILGSTSPNVNLIGVKCINCQDKKLQPVTIEQEAPIESRMRDLKRGIKYLLNVLLNPLIIFK